MLKIHVQQPYPFLNSANPVLPGHLFKNRVEMQGQRESECIFVVVQDEKAYIRRTK